MGNKHDKLEKRLRREARVAFSQEALEAAQQDARDAFVSAFERIGGDAERAAHARVDELVEESRAEARAVSEALHEVLETTQAASCALLDELRLTSESVQEQIRVTSERVQEELRVTSDRVQGQFGVASDRVQAEFRDAVAEVDAHRVALVEARSESDRVAEELAQRGHEQFDDAARTTQDLIAQLEATVAELRETAASRIADASQLVEADVARHVEAFEVVIAQATDQVVVAQHASEENCRQVGEAAAVQVGESLQAMEEADKLQESARLRIADAVAVVEQQCRDSLSWATERAGELLARAEADAAEIQRFRIAIERAEADALLAVLEPEDAAPAIEYPAAAFDPEADAWPEVATELESDPERETSDSGSGNDVEDEEPGPDGDGPSPDSDPIGAFAFAPTCMPDDDPAPSTPVGIATGPLPSSSADDPWLLVAAAEGGPEPGSTRTAVMTPVRVSASVAELTACAQRFASHLVAPTVRVELRHRGSHDGATAYLRLTIYHSMGWWEYQDVRASADTFETQSTVVDLSELVEALATSSRFFGGTEAELVMTDGDITIGSYLLLAEDPEKVPELSDDRKRTESVDLRAVDRSRLVLETQLGRLFVPPELRSYLRAQQTSTAELGTVDGMPCLFAEFDDGTGAAVPRMVARLHELGENDVPSLSERRNNSGGEVSQLISTLSTTTTPEELARILKIGVGYIRRRAAAHPALPRELIDDLLREGTETMRAAAASNASIGSESAALAVADSSPVVRAAVAANPALPTASLEQLASDAAAHVRAHAALNPAAEPELLHRLATDEDASVRAAVASREEIDVETLLALASDPAPMVCAAVGGNPKCPPEALNELVSIVPDSVLANPSASPALLAAGSTIESPRLRATVAANPTTDPKRLRRLAHDNDPNVLRAVADHPRTPSSARRRARRSLDAAREGMLDFPDHPR